MNPPSGGMIYFSGIGRRHEFFVGEGDKAPVLAPGIVENIDDQRRFGLDVVEVDRCGFSAGRAIRAAP